MVPPISRARSRLIDRPRPVPPYRRLVVPSACWNASKMMRQLVVGDADAGVDHGERDHLLGVRQRRHVEDGVLGGAGAIRSVTAPLSVNFTALESRLRRICCKPLRVGDHRRRQVLARPVPGSPGPSPRPAARTPARRSRAARRSGSRSARRPSGPPRSWTGRGCRRSAQQVGAGRRGWSGRTRSASALRFCSGFSASSRASSSSEFSGVRSSWLMLARNSDLYAEARVSCCAFSSRPSRASSISRFFVSMLRLLLGQQLRLLLQLGVGALQLRRLLLHLVGQPLRLGQQLLGTPVGLDGVDRDADGEHQPLQERQVQLGERPTRWRTRSPRAARPRTAPAAPPGRSAASRPARNAG